MPQETNFNVSPYFDDFDKNKEYYRVLFKPGYPVQARELTTSQSILQNQIEQFGSKFFKEGQIVIPGTISYDNPIYAVEIDPNFNGLPISLYFDKLKGKRIKGNTSGVTAEIVALLTNSLSERGNYTLYLKYLESGGENLNIKRFQDGEILTTLDLISYGSNSKFTIQINQGFANAISVNCTSEGSAVSISDGVCFVRGIFTNVKKQTLILSQYSTKPTYKIGFDIIERIVTSDEDESLFDNARSFSNYTAPGADRLKLELVLSKKEISEVELDSFVELMRVNNGFPTFPNEGDKTEQARIYNVARSESAKALSDISGDFFVKPFSVFARDSLNDRVLSDGIYFEDQSTVSGNTPSEDKLVYQIGPGKAYVNGYVVETTSTRLLDVDKPRSSDTCSSELIDYNAGLLFIVNNTFGAPSLGIGTTSVVSLMDSRIGSDKSVSAGTTIGIARVYDFIPESEYVDNLSRMHLRLFDVQTFTKLEFAKKIPIEQPTFIRGQRSNATAHAAEFSPQADIQSITFPITAGIGTVIFNSSGIATVTTIGPHGVTGGDVIFINGTGIDQLDYISVGTKIVDSIVGPSTFNVQFQGLAPNNISSPSGVGNYTISTAPVYINCNNHPFKNNDEVFIRNTSNNKFNKNFNVTVINSNRFTLNGITALVGVQTFYDGPTSSVLGNAIVGITTVKFQEVTGQFIDGESVIFNELESESRLIKDITEYDLKDVKSIYSKVGINTFNSDIVLEIKSSLAPPGTFFEITSGRSGISTVSAAIDGTITSGLKIGDIVSFSDFLSPVDNNGSKILTYNKVNSISLDGKSFTLVGLTTVQNYVNGGLWYNPLNPTDSLFVSNLQKVYHGVTQSQDQQSLLTRLGNSYVSSLDLENNTIIQRREFRSVSFNNYELSVTINPSEKDVYFAPFDEDRYVITYLDGTKENVRFDRFNVDTSGKTAVFSDLSKQSGNANVIVTVTNFKPNSKVKKLNKASVLNVINSKYDYSSVTTDGLTYSRVYGTRVQDKEISLNVPDAIRVLAIYESSGTSEANLPTIQSNTSISGFVVGETIVGKTSGAVAIVVKKSSNNVIEYVYLNAKQFLQGESVFGKESGSSIDINSLSRGDKNITQNFTFDDGQENTFYGYSRIIRGKNVQEPKGKLKIVFQNYTIDASDTGEIFSINSYPSNAYKYDIPLFNGQRLSDFIDLRPRVKPYTLNNRSPFDFSSREFNGEGQYSNYILCPGENIKLCYKYYVGRIDKIVLLKNGVFDVVKGIPSISPKEPSIPDNSLEIATVNLPPYIMDINNVEVNVKHHKKYTMQDIRSLDERISRLEEYIVLNRLESKTENLKIKDADTGLDRFKSGFFVDAFTDTFMHDTENPDYKISIDDDSNTLRPTHYTTSLDLQLGSEVIAGVGNTYLQNADHDFVSILGSDTVKKTGDLITLNYQEIEYFDQPYATRTESVTPFLVKYWTGTVELRPSMDTWIEEREVVTQSFNTNTINLPRLPDINITDVRNIVTNTEVHRTEVNVQHGIFKKRWITSRGSWWRNNFRRHNERRFRLNPFDSRWWSRDTKGLNTKVVTTNGKSVIRFKANRLHFSDADEAFLRSVLPQDIANSYIAQVRTKHVNRLVYIDYEPSSVSSRTTSVNTTTTLSTSSNTVTTRIPPTITTSESVTETLSNFTEPIRFLRSRNIEFDVKGLRPRTRFYSFFEGIDVNSYIIPKLLEIEMISGKFQIGEIVESDPHFTAKKIRFRTCKPNHKTGPAANPTETYLTIPYRQTPPPTNYTEASDFINVDTRSLQLSSEVDFYGEVAVNMKIIGKTSGAVARITNLRLVSDSGGRLIGSLFIPDPKVTGNPKWINGENTFTIIDTPTLNTSTNDPNTINESSAEQEFTSSAVTNVTTRNILTTRNITITPSRNVNTTTITNNITNNTNVVTTENRTGSIVARWEVRDPLAQSFYVKDETGVFLTGVDVYFETKDESGIPVTLQIRTVDNGVPTNQTIPFSEVTLIPDEINVSTNGVIPTRFKFKSPVYLSGPKGQEVRGAPIASETTAEYAVVLLSNSANYRVFISRLGETDILTNVKVGIQPTLGSLFKSQNGTTWTPSQLEDLKYKLHRADFVPTGSVRYYNPTLALKNKKVTVLGENQLTTLSRRSILQLNGDAEIDNNVVPGVTILQPGKAKGKLIGFAGKIEPSGLGVTISNSGIGYTNGTFSNVEFINKTGVGRDAKANVIVSNGVISSVEIQDPGYAYKVGDILDIKSFGKDIGFGAQVVVSKLEKVDTLILDNVQKGSGNNDTGLFTSDGLGAQNQSNTIYYQDSIGFSTYVGFSSFSGLPLTVKNISPDTFYSGKHIKIEALNHGMHGVSNFVRVSNVRPENDQVNTKLTSALTSTETTSIIVNDTTGFETFEGFPVNDQNPGYVIIGTEIVGYTTVTSSTILGGTSQSILRGVDNSETQPYVVGVPVYKYELNGISLRRINKIHSFSEVNTEIYPIELNSFYIRIDEGDTDFDGLSIGANRNSSNQLNFKSTSSLGESGSLVSTNIQYELMTPNFSTIVPAGTKITAKARTYSGTSISADPGVEESFIDQGYVDISLEAPTVFSSPRIIGSYVNEDKNIDTLPKKSLSLEFNLSTNDSRISPVIDDIVSSVVLTSNIINAPAGIGEKSTFADVEYIRGNGTDLHEAVHISKQINLKLPSNSLKVILSSTRNEFNDVRVLYKIIRVDSPSGSNSNWEPFPGYSNYATDSTGILRVVDASKNDGSSDKKASVNSDDSFKDYEYTIDGLPEFNAFSIKIILASKNQATPPIIKDLRAIATLKPSL